MRRMHTDTWWIRNGRVIDPAAGRDETADVGIRDGRICEVDDALRAAARPLDAHGCIVAPGLLDLHVHFRDPGDPEAETIASGSAAAARGGFTTVVTMPNTRPPIDTAAAVAGSIARGEEAGLVAVRPAGCMTRDRAGRAPADLAAMAAAGAVAFTDDGATVADENVLRAVMRRAAELGIPVMDHALDPALAGGGVLVAGAVSARLGLPGIPAAAETRAVERDIRLAEETGAHIHIQHVFCGETVELIRAARERGVRVSGELTPHHLALADADIPGDDACYKMNPPLGTPSDRERLREGICSGALQAFATDHAPHTAARKRQGFRGAPFGVVGLETAVGVTYTELVLSGQMPAASWLARWTTGPAALLALPAPSLAAGAPADVTVLDVASSWTVRAAEFVSRSANTPFEGRRLTGRPVAVFHRGRRTC